MLTPLQADIQPGTRLCLTFSADHMDEVKQKEAEALAAFQALYGGIETILPSVTWDLGQLWDLVRQYSDWQAEAEDQQEREKVSKAELTFYVAGQDEQENGVAQANLTWQYLSDSPAAATLDNLSAERNRLDAATAIGPLFTNNDSGLTIHKA